MNPFLNVKNVLVFGAHGDDEIIGCGGTLWQLSQKGVGVVMVTFTNRETAYADLAGKEGAAEVAQREMSAADRVLEISKRIGLGIPNQAVTNDRDTFQAVVKLIRKYRPEVILTHSPNDHHRDHRAIRLLVDEARWKAWEKLAPDWGDPHETNCVLYFEIMMDLIAKPHLIVTFNEEALNKKLEAMATQVSQLDILRGIQQQIRGTAMLRGGSVGGEKVFGEAFQISDFHPTRVHL